MKRRRKKKPGQVSRRHDTSKAIREARLYGAQPVREFLQAARRSKVPGFVLAGLIQAHSPPLAHPNANWEAARVLESMTEIGALVRVPGSARIPAADTSGGSSRTVALPYPWEWSYRAPKSPAFDDVIGALG